MVQKCETTLQCCLSAFSVHECEQWLAQEIGFNLAERTARTNVAKLNTTVRRQVKNGGVKSAQHRTATIVGIYQWLFITGVYQVRILHKIDISKSASFVYTYQYGYYYHTQCNLCQFIGALCMYQISRIKLLTLSLPVSCQRLLTVGITILIYNYRRDRCLGAFCV